MYSISTLERLNNKAVEDYHKNKSRNTVFDLIMNSIKNLIKKINFLKKY